MENYKLKPEMIPRTSFFKNLRSILSTKEWDIVRRKVYAQANYKCEICGGKGNRHPVECHELWSYDYKTQIQKFTGLIALCPACHEVVHIGLAQVRGRYKNAHNHLMKVNGIGSYEATEIVDNAFEEWQGRSMFKWELDISELDNWKS